MPMVWENLQAQPAAGKPDDEAGGDEINARHEPGRGHDAPEQPAEIVLKVLEGRARFLGGVDFLLPVGTNDPHGQHRDQRAGKQVGRRHGKPDGQGQRHEQRLGRAHHEERRNEHRHDA